MPITLEDTTNPIRRMRKSADVAREVRSAMTRELRSIAEWNDVTIAPGEQHVVELAVGESFSGMSLRIPLSIRRAVEDGPVVFVTAALHGDELNGTGAVRQLVQDHELKLTRGSLILVPVLNLPGFERHSRYLPDRRDLNRCFPGSASGSLAGRMARTIFDEIVSRSDFGIDLHTAAIRRTNYPSVRADLSLPALKKIATAFGTEILLDGKGPKGALRREATRAGCPTIVMEGGEVWKVEPTIVESALRGIRNVLRSLDMLDGEQERPTYQVTARKTSWIRADRGGFLDFHIAPGDLVEKGQPLATNTNLLGHEKNVLHSPFDGIVLGMTTLPAVSPGEPVCHIGKLPRSSKVAELQQARAGSDSLEGRIVDGLATNVMVVDRVETSGSDSAIEQAGESR